MKQDCSLRDAASALFHGFSGVVGRRACGAHSMLCVGGRGHVGQLHVRAHAHRLYGVPLEVRLGQIAHGVHKVGGLLHDAAARLQGVPPRRLGDVVVGAVVAPHKGHRLPPNLPQHMSGLYTSQLYPFSIQETIAEQNMKDVAFVCVQVSSS